MVICEYCKKDFKNLQEHLSKGCKWINKSDLSKELKKKNKRFHKVDNPSNKVFFSLRFDPYTMDRITLASEKTGLNKSKIIRKVFSMIEKDKIQAKAELLTEAEKIIWEVL